ncbi:hypothetical protein NM208_g10830 [Fusarium decemcellulare]|uniref:Uncharacterized protein n=1 Tax=Fusarium decemcellulare TaxID=57161 RepID=A0ACC1RWN5_9HYPO|nr:hypothetical protein NM208_g10830 [Fusarium decemcellulare]
MSTSSTVVITSKAQFDSLLKSSRLVIADCPATRLVFCLDNRLTPAIPLVYADWCGPCKQIAPIYERLSASLSRENVVTFVKINSDEQGELSQAYSVSALPTFLVFREGKVIEKVQGADPRKLQSVIQNLAAEVESLNEGAASGSGSGSGADWKGAEIPRGYSDITDQIEVRDLELLNADEDAGSVRVLFDSSKPSALNNGKGTSKDFVQSGADDQLLLYIPFQSTLTSVPPQDDEDAPMRPANINLYINRPHNLDFSEADDTEPTQAIEISPEDWNAEGTVNLGLRFVKFQKTSSLVVYVQQGEGDGETVRLDRVKLIGEAGTKREMGKLQKVGEDE